MNEKTDKDIGDSYERLAFERVMRNRKERFYASKVDYLININETSDIFGNYEIQTILFLVTIIFVNYAYSISFLDILLELNLYF